MLEFAKYIKGELKSNSQIVHKPANKDDPQRRRPDITRAKAYLGWEPRVKVIDGLRKTIDYFKKVRVCMRADACACRCNRNEVRADGAWRYSRNRLSCLFVRGPYAAQELAAPSVGDEEGQHGHAGPYAKIDLPGLSPRKKN
jgi:hypothetical protein